MASNREVDGKCATCRYKKPDGWCSLRNIYVAMGLTQECFFYEPDDRELARSKATLEAENERLRGLVMDFMGIVSAEAFDCYGCKYDEQVDCNFKSDCRLLERARNLGVVPECSE